MASQEAAGRAGGGRVSPLYDPRVRGLVLQALLFAVLAALIWWIVDNTIDNLRRAHIASGFGFLSRRAGFDIGDALIDYNSGSTILRALVVGLLNTALVSISGIVTATIIGLIVGIGRLSRNWLIRKLCMLYVEVFRNIPPLLVIFFWYFGVLAVLPLPRNSIEIGLPLGIHTPFGTIGSDKFISFGSYLNSRGFYFPAPVFGEHAWLMLLGLVIGILLSIFVARRARARQTATGEQFPVFWTSVALIVGLPALAFVLAGFPLSFAVPKRSIFNLTGGLQVKPEFLSLFLALSFYTASFIAEIVRAGILGVNRGQTEAAYALGLRPGPTLRLIILPQALRIIIPPLTSQYLNLMKNSSLAITVGYSDLVAIGGTVLNQTGQAIEIVAIWMLVYLGLSLLVSAFMNWFNARMALVER